MRYHFTSVRMAIISNKSWQGCRGKGTLVHCWWDCRMVQPLWKTVWNFLTKLKMELPFDPAIPLLDIYPKNPKIPIQKTIYSPYVHSSIIYNSRDLETAYAPVSRWVDKKAVVHLHNGILCSNKKEGLLTFPTAWMGLSEIRQSVKDKHHMISLITGI